MKANEIYERITSRKVVAIAILAFLLFPLMLTSLCVGTADLEVSDVISSLFLKLLGLGNRTGNSSADIVVWQLRLPRTLMAVVVGMALASSGVVLQAILRNPLASPYTLGISSSASFGAALAVILGAGFYSWREIVFLNPYAIAISAFTFSSISTAVILGLAKLRSSSPETLVLAGIAMAYLFSAATSLLQYFATSEQVTAIVFWMFGDMSKADWTSLPVVGAVTIVSISILYGWALDLNALAFGDEVAESLGVSASTLRLGCTMISALATSIPIAFLGTIAFIGLLAPHIARMLVGGDHRFLFPASCLVGADLLLSADITSRVVMRPVVLPIGVVTSMLGIPLFLHLLLRRRKEYW